MRKQIRAELLKLRKSSGFLSLLLSMLGIGVALGFVFLSAFEPVSGLEAFNRGIMAVEINIIVISIFAALFICGEFENRTIGTGLFCGRSRWSILLAKISVYFIGVAILVTVFLAAITMIVTVRNGFCAELTADVAQYLVRVFALYVLGRLALASFCAMLAFIIRNYIGTIGVGICLSISLIFLIMQGPQDIVKFTFMWQLRNILFLNGTQDVLLSALVSVVNMALMLLVAHFAFKKVDIK
jgi:ABC-2 type transport system permease protein